MPDLTDRLQDFVSRNPNVDLLNVDFSRAAATDQLDLGDGSREAAIETLKTAQRLLRGYPSTAVAAPLPAACAVGSSPPAGGRPPAAGGGACPARTRAPPSPTTSPPASTPRSSTRAT